MLGKKGFTLIELMVVIAIIGIMAGIAVANFGRNPDRDVRLEKDRLVTFLRDVQGKALAAEKVSEASGKICGFVIRQISASPGNQFQVYYVHTAGASPQDASCASSADTTESIIDGNIFYPGNGVTVSLLDAADYISFLVPQGNVSYNGGSIPPSGVDITLSKTAGALNASVHVTITPGGVIK